MQYFLGFDPGRDKCGVAVMSDQRELLTHEVVPAGAALAKLRTWAETVAIATVVLGDQTTSRQWQQRLLSDWPDCPPIVLVDERHSTLEARDRYWQMYPPQGLQRLVPQGMRQPPRAIDDIVAVLLIERYLNARSRV